MQKDGTIYRGSDTAFSSTERGELKGFFKRRELFPQAKKDALASLDELGRCIAYEHNEGKVDAVKLIIESIEDF